MESWKSIGKPIDMCLEVSTLPYTGFVILSKSFNLFEP